MLEPPRLADAAIVAALRAHYRIEAAALTFLPIGADSATAVYRADTAAGERYFLKLRAGHSFRTASLAVPHYLHSQGVPHILAPLAAAGGALWADMGDYTLTLYPLLEARTAYDAGLSDDEWRTLGATTQRIHSAQLPPDMLSLLRAESFIPSRRTMIDRMTQLAAEGPPADDLTAELAALWRARGDTIRAVVARANQLGAELRQRQLPLALCHADLHCWNVLVDGGRQLWIVDWDEVVLAPKERDLMFVVGGIGSGLVSPHQSECFLEGYRGAPIDQAALAYYRAAWAVQDLAAYAEEACFSPELGQVSRAVAVQRIASMFDPGNIVELALTTNAEPSQLS
jgi:spectinomycin phosphotransferase